MERPIGFNTEMVQAILAGRKSQTRRLCKDQTALNYRYVKNIPMYPTHPQNKTYTGWIKECDTFPLLPTKCRYGVVGDLLWVKETHKYSYVGYHNNEMCESYIEYKADGVKVRNDKALEVFKKPYSYLKWRSPRFMHKWASRITLEITDIKIERVQEITLEEIICEGISAICESTNPEDRGKMVKEIIRGRFISLWDSINDKKGYGWEVNPWVWVISFKRSGRSNIKECTGEDL